MPLRTKRLDNRIRDRLPTFLALRAIPMSVTVHTPSIPILLHKRRCGIEWVTALRAEEVSGVPFSATGHNDLTFNWRFAGLATWREHLVKVEMAEEALGLIGTIFMLKACHVVWRGVRREEGNVFTPQAGANARDALCELVVWLRVESNAFEVFAALVAGKALGMETKASCRDDAACDGQGTRRTKSVSADIGGCPVGARVHLTTTNERP